MDRRLIFSRSAIEHARALCRSISQTDVDEAAEQLRAMIAAGTAVDGIDPRDGTPELFVWMTPPDGAEPWGSAIVKGDRVVTVLSPGETRRKLRIARKQPKVLELDASADAAVLLRYRSEGVAGVLAVEVMRDGTARYVTTSPMPGTGSMGVNT